MRKNLLTIVQIVLLGVLLSSCNSQYEVKNEHAVSAPKVDLKEVTVNVYIENSGSMDGYMLPESEFKNDLYSYISAISNKVKTTNLNYLNSAVIRIPKNPEPFSGNLNPTSFKAEGLNRSHSEIVDMFKEMLNRMGENTISIFASDCILDVGSGGDAKKYFENRRTTLRDTIARYLNKNKDFAVEILCSESQFNGYLYPYQSKPIPFNGKRPYYVWVFGPKDIIGALNLSVSPYESFRTGGIKNSAAFADCGQMPFVLSLKAKEGNSIMLHGKKKEFDILVDMSSSLLSDEQITDNSSYSYADAKASVDAVGKITDKQSVYTHFMHIKFNNASKPIKQIISISMNNEPRWAESLNDDSIGVDTKKTYGIKYLIYAVSDAYKNASPAQIQFVINKK